MQNATLVVLAALIATTLAAGQYYVPRAYYIIDAEGNQTPPVPLRRLRRSLNNNYPPSGGATANANANAVANANANGNAQATANANAYANANVGRNNGMGSFYPGREYGASNPASGAELRAGQTAHQAGPIIGTSLAARTSIGLNSSGQGYYDQTASVGN